MNNAQGDGGRRVRAERAQHTECRSDYGAFFSPRLAAARCWCGQVFGPPRSDENESGTEKGENSNVAGGGCSQRNMHVAYDFMNYVTYVRRSCLLSVRYSRTPYLKPAADRFFSLVAFT